MPEYGRFRVPGGTYFFTTNASERRTDMRMAYTKPCGGPAVEPNERRSAVRVALCERGISKTGQIYFMFFMGKRFFLQPR